MRKIVDGRDKPGHDERKENEETRMPEITVSMAAGRTDEQKAGMMRDITQALVKNVGPQDEGRQDFRGAGSGAEKITSLVIPGRVKREPQMCNCTSGNLELTTSGFRVHAKTRVPE
jgi:hypothetical protein